MSQPTTFALHLAADAPVTPANVAIRTKDSVDALLSSHSGTATPSYAVAGTVWHDTDLVATTPLAFWDGSANRFVLVEDADGDVTVTAVLTATMVKTEAVVVASLVAAATAGAGARSFVTDATVTTFASTVVGGGANAVPVVSDGTNWIIG